jgi:hypothetical protein
MYSREVVSYSKRKKEGTTEKDRKGKKGKEKKREKRE